MPKYFLYVAHGNVSQPYLKEEGDSLVLLINASDKYPRDEKLWNNFCWIEDGEGKEVWNRE